MRPTVRWICARLEFADCGEGRKTPRQPVSAFHNRCCRPATGPESVGSCPPVSGAASLRQPEDAVRGAAAVVLWDRVLLGTRTPAASAGAALAGGGTPD